MLKKEKNKMPKKETNNKKQKDKKKLMLIVGMAVIALAVLTALIGFLVSSGLSNQNQSSQEGLALDDFYSSEQCRCLEKNRPLCNLEGFEYNKTRDLCVNYAEKKVTYPTLACSSYECIGVNYQYNFDDKTWEG